MSRSLLAAVALDVYAAMPVEGQTIPITACGRTVPPLATGVGVLVSDDRA